MIVKYPYTVNIVSEAGARLNIRLSSYHEGDSHYKKTTVSRPSYHYHGNPYTQQNRLYIKTGHRYRSHQYVNNDMQLPMHDKYIQVAYYDYTMNHSLHAVNVILQYMLCCIE